MIYPMLLANMTRPPYGIRCPCNPHARASSHLGQWQSPLFRRDFDATPGAASPNGIHGDRSARQRAYAEFGPDAHFFSALRLLRRAAMDRKPVVFHARRNIEMVQALLLRCLGASTLKIAFTSTAQRYHSRFTRYLMRQMDSVISTCSAAASYLDPPPDQLIPHGIDTARFHRDRMENRHVAKASYGPSNRYFWSGAASKGH